MIFSVRNIKLWLVCKRNVNWISCESYLDTWSYFVVCGSQRCCHLTCCVEMNFSRSDIRGRGKYTYAIMLISWYFFCKLPVYCCINIFSCICFNPYTYRVGHYKKYSFVYWMEWRAFEYIIVTQALSFITVPKPAATVALNHCVEWW